MGKRRAATAQTHAVGTCRKGVELGRNAAADQRLVEPDCSGHRDRLVVGRMEEECRRCRLRDVLDGSKLRVLSRVTGGATPVLRKVAVGRGPVGTDLHSLQPRIGEDQEVRAAADALDGITGIGLAGRCIHCGGGSQVATCREPHHADAFRIDVESLGIRSHGPNSARAVEQWERQPCLGPNPVRQDERGDPTRREPRRRLDSLEHSREADVCPAGSNDYRCSVRPPSLRPQHRQSRGFPRDRSELQALAPPQAIAFDLLSHELGLLRLWCLCESRLAEARRQEGHRKNQNNPR